MFTLMYTSYTATTTTGSGIHCRRVSCEHEAEDDHQDVKQQKQQLKARGKRSGSNKIRTPPMKSHYACVRGKETVSLKNKK